ncbi:ABC transporter [Microbacterium sp. H1-D42]|uniref:ABC transporter n=1 Tax=Microbacterium sp. H1-D42 TaxID=2925844 RepID=UPI001F52CA24|nr:ABC transporter [Microbacterium sp. H1-D42]UNK71610.1 ABC transporter [Microbacterium sp. H1-D42]
MSDPEVPQNKQSDPVDDVVDSANEGLDAAAAARAETPGPDSAADAADADMEAFAAAERDHPGTFETPGLAESAEAESDAEPVAAATAVGPADEFVTSTGPVTVDSADTHVDATPTVADTAYAAGAASFAETQIMPAEPVAPPPASPQPIFVQAPEPPRELGNRATAGAIGLLATLSFAILYLGAILGFGALQGTVTDENVGAAALAPLSMWSYWVPVAVFFIAFWLLGAIINRGRWGHWVIWGIFVAAATYGGHILGQLFQAPFWRITASEAVDLVDAQLLAPLAIAAFVFARELTIWFGAWAARAGARKKVLNAEAQAEYERTLEAGPGPLR